MNDLIDRQAAIDAECEVCQIAQKKERGHNCTYYVHGCKEIECLRALPSAQPEIIRCKDCRWGRETCGNIECFVDLNVPPEYHGYEWFCPNGERRTDETD